nr:carboxylesterase family protein [Streptomyces verrucosisporus]
MVTINYRLGAPGSLALPSLSEEAPDHASGAYGLMDQQAALRWVRANIAPFPADSFALDHKCRFWLPLLHAGSVRLRF